MRPIVIIESPFAGDTKRNTAYARAALRDSLLRGEAPFASHLLYTQPGVLRDDVPAERALGIDAGLYLARKADLTAVYVDIGISAGMQAGIDHANACARPVMVRVVPGWSVVPPTRVGWDANGSPVVEEVSSLCGVCGYDIAVPSAGCAWEHR